MRFYHIWAKLFSFESKNTNKILNLTLEIRSMHPKNAIKMINIQKSYSVHIVSLWSNLSSVQFNPIWSYLVHSIHHSFVRSNSIYLVHFSPIQSIQSTLALFSSYWSYLVYFGFIQSIMPTLVLFGPIRSILSARSTSVWFGPFCTVWSYSVHFVHFDSIWSYLVHIDPIRSTSVLLVLFCPLCQLRSYLVRFGPSYNYLALLCPFGPIQSFKSLQFILVYFNLFLCTYAMRKDI